MWGLGGSLGVAVGLLVFALAKEGLNHLLGISDFREVITKFNSDSLKALHHRNELTVETINAVERIASVIEDKSKSG
jgi:spore maturation protein CgeB